MSAAAFQIAHFISTYFALLSANPRLWLDLAELFVQTIKLLLLFDLFLLLVDLSLLCFDLRLLLFDGVYEQDVQAFVLDALDFAFAICVGE